MSQYGRSFNFEERMLGMARRFADKGQHQVIRPVSAPSIAARKPALQSFSLRTPAPPDACQGSLLDRRR